jgi:hypothetical protein
MSTNPLPVSSDGPPYKVETKTHAATANGPRGTGDRSHSVEHEESTAARTASRAERDAILDRLHQRRTELLDLESAGPLTYAAEVELAEILAEIDRYELAEHEDNSLPALVVLQELTGRLLGIRTEIERHRR